MSELFKNDNMPLIDGADYNQSRLLESYINFLAYNLNLNIVTQIEGHSLEAGLGQNIPSH